MQKVQVKKQHNTNKNLNYTSQNIQFKESKKYKNIQ